MRLLLAALVAALASSAQAQGVRAPAEPVKIEVSARVIDSFDPRDRAKTRFGSLTFRGGLVLTAPQKEFGGLSAIRVQPDGRFLAVTDRGNWLRGRIVMEGDKPRALADVETAPVLALDGRPSRRTGRYDTEAMADDGAGQVYIGFERTHEVMRFDIGRFGLRARGVAVPMPPSIKGLRSNASLECVFVPAKGQPLAGVPVAIAERAREAEDETPGFIGGSVQRTFALRRDDEFDVTDCATTPTGDLLILERRFSWWRGLAVRLRRVPLAQVVPGARLDAAVIFSADLGQEIDNLEGLSVHRAADGATVLTMVSDDNFSPIQRTLLLQFTLER